MSRKDKRTTEEFLIELKESGNWNDDYDYSLVVYDGKMSKIIVLHKEFNTKHLFSPKDLLKGKKCSTRNLLGGKNGYRSVEDSLKFIQSLKLKNTDEWLEFRKTDKLPFDIPTKPRVIYGEVYKKTYGKTLTMGIWLGTNSIQDGLQEWVEFDEFQEFVRSKNFKSQTQWYEFVKNNPLPKNYPKTPTISKYKNQFKGWPKLLGTNLSYSYKKFTYEESKDYLRDKGLTLTEWESYINSSEFDGRIPKLPSRYYEDSGWEKWSNFLNYTPKTVVGNKLSFEESRSVIQKFNLKGQGEFRDLRKTKDFPQGIPKNPDISYEEFTSWSDFLGYIGDGKSTWTKHAILSFIKSINHELVKLDSIELITIINSNNLAKKIKDLGFLEDLVSSKSNTNQREKVVSKIEKQISDLVGNSDDEEIDLLPIQQNQDEEGEEAQPQMEKLSSMYVDAEIPTESEEEANTKD